MLLRIHEHVVHVLVSAIWGRLLLHGTGVWLWVLVVAKSLVIVGWGVHSLDLLIYRSCGFSVHMKLRNNRRLLRFNWHKSWRRMVLNVIWPLLRLIDVHQTWLRGYKIVWSSHDNIRLLVLNSHILVLQHLLLLTMINCIWIIRIIWKCAAKIRVRSSHLGLSTQIRLNLLIVPRHHC